MSTMRALGVAHAGATEWTGLIRVEMAVEDASGERFGRVIDFRIDPASVVAGGVGPASGVQHAPDLPTELSGRLRKTGYIKIADTRYFRRDFRYYATIDQVASIDASVVRLDRYCRDLITAFD
jgi:hypothetical protein